MSIAPSLPGESRPMRTVVSLERFLARVLVGTGLLLAVATLIFMAAFSLDELSARQRLLRMVDETIAEQQAALSAAPGPAAGDAATARMRGELERSKDVRTATQLLMASGGGGRDDEVIALRAKLRGREAPRRSGLDLWLVREVRQLSNATLLIILLTVCGAIGNALAAARRKTHFSMYSLGMGMAAGFITYLAIAGGKEVLLVGASADDIVVNPNSSAFFALMAGMFTERAYGMLASMMDSFAGHPKGGKEG